MVFKSPSPKVSCPLLGRVAVPGQGEGGDGTFPSFALLEQITQPPKKSQNLSPFWTSSARI